MIEAFDSSLEWIIIASFCISFLLAFSVGANDVSNSFGTSVGSKVLTVTQACLLATFFEVAGATLLGYEVCDTFRRKMLDYSLYKDSQKELMLGFFSCLIGSSAWNLIATKLKMPISGTHCVIGATIGFAIVSRGVNSIKWLSMIRIVASWFASPVLSGLCSSLIYVVISKCVLEKSNPLEPGLKVLPIFYGIAIFINVSSLVISGPKGLHLDNIPWWAGVIISIVAGLIAAACVIFFIVNRLRNNIKQEMSLHMKPPRKAIGDTKRGQDNQSFEPDNTGDGQAPGTSRDVDLGLPTDSRPSTKEPRPPVANKPTHLAGRRGRGAGQGTPVLQLRSASLGDEQQQPRGDKKGVTKIYVAGPGGRDQPIKSIDDDGIHDTEDSVVTDMQKMGAQECRVDLDLPQLPLPEPNSGSKRYNDDPVTPGYVMGERLEIFRLFAPLQIMTSCFASFAHGTNDVSNAVAPLAPIWFIYINGEDNLTDQTPVWILFFGGIGICTGLWAWGRSVMNTLGSGLTKLNASKGFAIELGAATAVLAATKLGLPISTTHCKVGSVVIVALVASKFCKDPPKQAALTPVNGKNPETTKTTQQTLAVGGSQNQIIELEKDAKVDENSVQWGMFGSIVISWIVTVPFAALCSAITMYILQSTAL